jgi:hypothetical protein
MRRLLGKGSECWLKLEKYVKDASLGPCSQEPYPTTYLTSQNSTSTYKRV